MTEPAEVRKAIAAAIIVHEGRVLLVRRKVKEGSLSWQFPAGEVEDGEASTAAAVRETREETGLEVKDISVLGERVHPNTGRTMVYVACQVVSGTAAVVDDDELAEVAWSDGNQITDYVPYPFYGPVQAHLDASLSR
ncbi:NUDIX hydrolase [Amycolatopsis saalfeldensis]|uniref:8-oxo-dGTP diphosphatase n=1 Tax=Amycolatopsis saalfeldensis TaxID=394193 RepID=A0A1H8YPN3_9PSEU|nr:NUDIX hydrolase [Amycolatopsis saalfeldensis]SEP54164.1 8-oxo-dGTP diphosphatase [Amycolatopsis saalfeldensis]